MVGTNGFAFQVPCQVAKRQSQGETQLGRGERWSGRGGALVGWLGGRGSKSHVELCMGRDEARW